jgi:CRISPR-associated protein Csx16
MTVWFVSRHPGAIDWARCHGLTAQARIVDHLDPELVADGDTVAGTLPVDLAGAICARGALFYALVVPVTGRDRGLELSAADLEARGARLERYYVVRAPEG